MLQFLHLYIYIYAYIFNEIKWISIKFLSDAFQYPLTTRYLVSSYFPFYVMLIANPFPSVFMGRIFFLESFQCSPGRSEIGLKHAWTSLKYIELREREREREREWNPARLIFSQFLIFLYYDMLRHYWKHPNVFGGIVTRVYEHMFRTVFFERIMKSVKLRHVKKW